PAQAAVGAPRDDRVETRADRVGVAGDVAQSVRRHHQGVVGAVTGGDHVVRLRGGRVQQLQQADVRVTGTQLPTQILQVRDLERLDLHRRRARVRVRGQ